MTSATAAPPALPPDLTATLRSRLSHGARLTEGAGAAGAMVQVAEVSDVVAAVRLAGRHGVALAVRGPGRSGGPGAAGRPGRPGGPARRLTVDPDRLAQVTVSPAGWARVGAGVSWRELAGVAGRHGLTPLTGGSASERVADTVTGGGVGPLARTYGLAADRVRAVEVVTGDGALRRVTPDDEPELFWGLRGGGAALGVVTAVELDLLAAGPRYGGQLRWAPGDAARVLDAWRAWTATLPAQAGTSLVLSRPRQGEGGVAVRFAWAGDPEDGVAVLDGLLGPLAAGGRPLDSEIAPRGPAGLATPQQVTDPGSSLLADRLPDDGAGAVLRAVRGSRPRTVELRLLGGALGWVPERPSAVCHRDARLAVLVTGGAGSEDRAATRACTDDVAAAFGADLGGREPAHGFAAVPDVLARTPTPAVRDRLAALAADADPHRVLEGAAPR
ncbi:FAD-binding oxidoreductase [Geodermatophilus sp. SYSU D01106]